jgi:hypothetical protein
LDIQAILDMPAGSWLAYGLPWNALEASGALQQDRDNCGRGLDAIVTAWNGLAFDGASLWNFAGGGHGDGCFNGIIRYDLEAAAPEVAAPHIPLNMPICWGPFTKANGTLDCYYEPYASVTPAPICTTTSDPNCENIPLQDILDAGLSILSTEFQQETARFGAFLRPRSSHNYNNIVFWQGYVYMMTGQTYGGIRADAQVWRFDPADPLGTTERLPDRWNPLGGGGRGGTYGGYNANLVAIPGRGVLVFGGNTVCEADMAAGTYDCSSHPINVTNSASLAWDDGRQGVWMINSQFERISFLKEDVDGVWRADPTLGITDAALSGANIGRAGICLVPTAQGANPVIWGTNATLLRWDGTTLSEVTGQVDQPATSSSTVLNKWRWNDDLGVCLGAWSWTRGVDAWRPDFSDWQQAEAPQPDPDPEPAPEPQPGNWPTFAGHVVAPAAWQPAAWDAPIERQPEAPDYDALCPGPWAVLDITEPYDPATMAAQMRGLSRSGNKNVRVYLHPLPDNAAYQGAIKFEEVTCGELVGVPVDGKRPKMAGNAVPSGNGGGLIVRGIEFEGGIMGWAGSRSQNIYPKFLVMHDSIARNIGQLYGDSPPSAPLTYLELRGNVIYNNLDWHTLYLERSIGRLVALSNVMYGPGRGNHAFKNLAHQSRIEGNVFSNAGPDGRPLAYDSRGIEIVGLAPLDLYLCTETIFRNNTVLFRTSDVVRAFVLYRGRNAWGNCDKGKRLTDGRWEIWPPESEAYHDPVRWAEIHAALPAFDQGFDAARAEPWLFTHLSDGNTFVVFNAQLCHGVPCDDTRAAEVHSLRPLADNAVEAVIQGESNALSDTCATAADRTACYEAGMSPALRYAYERYAPSHRATMVKTGDMPNNVPIQHPTDWRERAGLWWDDNHFITCSADGLDCQVTGQRRVKASPSEWDDVQVAHPPRVIMQ